MVRSMPNRWPCLLLCLSLGCRPSGSADAGQPVGDDDAGLPAVVDDGGPGSAALDGSLAFPVRFSRAWYPGELVNAKDPSLVQVWMMRRPVTPFCAEPTAEGAASVLMVQVGTTDGGPVVAGTYSIDVGTPGDPGGTVQVVRAEVLDAGELAVLATSIGGSVTLTTAGLSGAQGRFFATLLDAPDGGDGGSARSELSGTFDAPGCPGP